jgi:hypothetical protein
VAVAVGLQLVVDPAGHPQDGQLAQGAQVAGAEVVGQRGVDALGRVDVAVGHAAPQRLGSHVDQLDLLGGPHHLVGDRLARPHAGDALDHVGDRLEVLDVERGDHVDARVQQHLDVLEALGVAGAGDVGVGQLVHQRHLGPAGQHCVEVHLRQHRPPVLDHAAGHHRQVALLLGRLDPTVRLHEADHHVGAALPAAAPLVEHGEGLAHARSRAQVDAQAAGRMCVGGGHRPPSSLAREGRAKNLVRRTKSQ